MNKIIEFENDKDKYYEDYEIYYNDMGLDQNESKALLYLRVAFQHCCFCFYNMTLPLYIMERYDSEYALITVLHLIGFFPHEKTLQSNVENLLKSKRSLNFVSRFVLFCFSTIRDLRNNTKSLKLVELKNMMKEFSNLVKTAIDRKCSVTYYEFLAKKCQKMDEIFREVIQNNPYNPKYCELYFKYLVDVECSFTEGMNMKNRQLSIEGGASGSQDFSFLSLVRSFPHYLKDKIVTFTGEIALQNALKKKLNNNVSIHNFDAAIVIPDANEKVSFNLENDEIEQMAKEYIRESKLRLYLDKMLETKVPKALRMIKNASIFILFYVIVGFLFGYVFSYIELNIYVDAMPEIVTLMKSIFYTSLSSLSISLEYFRENGLSKYTDEMKDYIRQSDSYYFDPYNNMLPQILDFTSISSNNLQETIKTFAYYSIQGENILSFSFPLLKIVQPLAICNSNGTLLKEYRSSFGSIITLLMSWQRELTKNETLTNFLNDSNTCEIVMNIKNLHESSNYLFYNVSKHQDEFGDYIEMIYNILAILVPCVTFFVVFLPFVIWHFILNSYMNKIITMINSFKIEDKNEAKMSLLLNRTEQTELSATLSDYKSNSSVKLILGLSFLAIVFCILTLVGTYTVLDAVHELTDLNG